MNRHKQPTAEKPKQKANLKKMKGSYQMVDSKTSEGRHGGNGLREQEIKSSTQTNTRARVAERVRRSTGFLSRRSFLSKSLAVGAGTIGAGLLANAPTARASGGLTAGDEAIQATGGQQIG